MHVAMNMYRRQLIHKFMLVCPSQPCHNTNIHSYLHTYNITCKRITLLPPYNRLFSLGTNFPEGRIALVEIFLIQKFMTPTTKKSHVSNISYKAYMGKTIICRTLAMSTVIIVLYLCMVTTCTYICTGVSKNSKSLAVYVHKEYNLVWPNPFLTQVTCSISAQPCHLPWTYICHAAIYVMY